MLDANKIFSSSILPSPPTIAIQLLEHTRNPESTIVDFVTTIKSDPAMAVRILKAANSSYFSFRSEITSLDRAVAMIGLKPVAMLVLSFSLIDENKVAPRVADFYQAYWLQAVVQAISAETISNKFHPGEEAEIFLVGLLLDIGRLVMLKTIPDQYGATLESFRQRTEEVSGFNLDLADHETTELGFSHVDIGMRLLQSWELPEKIIEAIGLHHQALDKMESLQIEKQTSAVRAGLFAAAMGDWFCSTNKGIAWERLQKIGKLFYNLSDPALEQLILAAREKIEAGGQLFSTNVDVIPPTEELLTQAKDQMTELAFEAQMRTAQVEEQKNQIEAEHRLLTEKTRQLETEVVRDNLTGVFSRKFFDETLAKEIFRCGRNGLGAAVMFCDIDDFKTVNDTYGHACGDEILKNVAMAMNRSIRSADILARYGGEEMVILLIDISPCNVNEIGERVRKSVENLSFDWGGNPISVTVSIGCCMAFPVKAGNELDMSRQMLEKADEAMYVAKRNGKNAIHYCQIESNPVTYPSLGSPPTASQLPIG